MFTPHPTSARSGKHTVITFVCMLPCVKGPDGRPPLHERKGLRQAGQAKQATSDLAFGKEVTVQTHGHDKYMRTLGDVLLPDGDPQPVLPWVYRKARRGQALDLSDLAPFDAQTEGGAVSCGPPRGRRADRVRLLLEHAHLCALRSADALCEKSVAQFLFHRLDRVRDQYRPPDTNLAHPLDVG